MSPPSDSPAASAISMPDKPAPPKAKKGARFWLAFLTISVALFLSALELSFIPTTLPSIVESLHGSNFVWVGTAYALTSTALLPMTGGLAQIFGRRITAILSIAIFTLGSALCGAAQSMNWLIAARAVQGLGGGAINAIASIVVSDLVTLQERGSYNAILGMVWAVALAVGPPIGGALARAGQWRWIFYINLPIGGAALVLAFFTLKLPTPPGTLREKLSSMDWIGNTIIMGSTSAIVIALSWGGVNFAWSSAHVLVPLIVGLCGLLFFFVYEAKIARYPMVPFSLLSSRTSVSGYIQVFTANVAIFAVSYYLPAYYQGCKDASPLRSSVYSLGTCLMLGPSIIVAGASVTITKKWRPQLWFAWIIFIIAVGSLTIVKADSNVGLPVGLGVLYGAAAGIVYAVSYFPVLSPLPVSANARALALFAFDRSLGSVWGIAIGAAILQNELSRRLPAEFVAQLASSSSQGISLSFSAIPALRDLPEPLKHAVQVAFADSIAVIWKVMTGIVGLGLLASVLMQDIPLHNYVDEQWALEQEAQTGLGEEKRGNAEEAEMETMATS